MPVIALALARPTLLSDEEITRRLCGLAECRALDWFWMMSRHGEVDRTWLLELMAKVAIARSEGWNPGDVRLEHIAKQGGAYGDSANVRLLYAEGCFRCRTADNLVPHHVIQIQNGGSNTLRNRVPLCASCHAYLHPWMELPERERGGPMRRLIDVIAKRVTEPEQS